MYAFNRARFTAIPLAIPLALSVFHARSRNSNDAGSISCDGNPDAVKDLIKRRRDELAGVYRDFMGVTKTPGLVGCIIHNGEIVYSTVSGTSNVRNNTPVDRCTRFRIASMSKSFTAMAIVKLRDEGKLSLDDKASKYFNIKDGKGRDKNPFDKQSIDSPDVTIRDLLTQFSGLPQDDPWGDRLLDIPEKALYDMAARGFAMSTETRSKFEYSNLGYAILGAIITKVAGMPFQQYIGESIFKPLGMNDTTFDVRTVADANKLAQGYRWEDGEWKEEPYLGDGVFGAMGGIITTLDDFAKYAAYHQSTYDSSLPIANNLVVSRTSLREMHRGVSMDGVVVADGADVDDDAARLPKILLHTKGNPQDTEFDKLGLTSGHKPYPPFATSYAYGLRANIDSHKNTWVRHAGGLPGFGSDWRFYPEHGLAFVTFANRTYAPVYKLHAHLGYLLVQAKDKETVKKKSFQMMSQGVLEQKRGLIKVIQSHVKRSNYDNMRNPPSGVFADNFFLDRSKEQWGACMDAVAAMLGDIHEISDVRAENNLRGTFDITSRSGRKATVYFTLSPDISKVQELVVTVSERPAVTGSKEGG